MDTAWLEFLHVLGVVATPEIPEVSIPRRINFEWDPFRQKPQVQQPIDPSKSYPWRMTRVSFQP